MASALSNNPSLFYLSIQGILKSWTALQLAVTHSFAGPYSKQKAQWLVGVTETYFKENKALEPFELEEFLEEILSTEFNTITEDDSLKCVSMDICNMYKLWQAGEHDKIRQRLALLPCVNLGECLSNEIPETMDDMSEDQQIINELNICQPNCIAQNTRSKTRNNELKSLGNITKNEPDDEGWVHVTRKKKHI